MSFRSKVDQAIAEAKKVLGNARNPVLPANCAHSYDDKYLLVEIGTRVAISAIRNSLDHATDGAFSRSLPQMLEWYRAKKTVILRTQAEEKCVFSHTTETDVKSNTSNMIATTSTLLGASTKESFNITKVTEHEWHFQVDWETFVYAGDEGSRAASKAVLASSCTSTTLITRSQKPHTPRPVHRSSLQEEVDLTWLLQALRGDTVDAAGSDTVVNFVIDRSVEKTCHTPRRNAQAEEAVTSFERLHFYQKTVAAYLKTLDSQSERAVPGSATGTSQTISNACSHLFDPVPATFVLEEEKDGSANEDGNGKGTVLKPSDLEAILKQQNTVMDEVLARLMASIPEGSMFNRASCCAILGHAMIGSHASSYSELIQEIESMLMSQLIGAIGKVVQPHHFAEYMDYHHCQLFDAAYAPRGFCQAVRRVNHCPEGTLSLEQMDEKGDYQPVPCFVASRSSCSDGEGAAPMTFPLNAAANLTFYGNQYLHSFVLHQFSGVQPAPMRLAARARQFSSFVLMVGSMSGPSSFAPDCAIIVKNKDDLLIPLLLETIPTPKQFRDSIESLSPEQQRFAKQFRAMQLNSTLFAMAVIQIKPQLERVLNLPSDALTKEIKLTQSLMELFVEYQIPPDLLSFSATEDFGKAPIAAVKEHVEEIMAMLAESKASEMEDSLKVRLKAELELEKEEFLPAAPMMEMRTMRELKSVPMSACVPSAASFGMAGGEEGGGPHPASRVMKKQAVQKSVQVPTADQIVKRPGSTATQSSISTPQARSHPQLTASAAGGAPDAEDSAAVDWTNIPKRMDESFEKLDTDSALRPTILKTSKVWQRTTQNGLLSKPLSQSCGVDQQKKERNKAFDLLDALTRSGAMSVETDASLHVVLCATHCFDNSVMDTLVQDNMNPIEKAERSSLIMASTIHRRPAGAMIKAERLREVAKWSPNLFAAEETLVLQGEEAKE